MFCFVPYPLPVSPLAATIYSLQWEGDRFLATIQCTKLLHVTLVCIPHLLIQHTPFVLVHVILSLQVNYTPLL